jgi:hypothetical protein
MELYARSDTDSVMDAQGKFLEELMADRIHPAHGASSVRIMGGIIGSNFPLFATRFFRNAVARDGVEPPTPAFSGPKLTLIYNDFVARVALEVVDGWWWNINCG